MLGVQRIKKLTVRIVHIHIRISKKKKKEEKKKKTRQMPR